jgi:hypothetical protein
MKNPSLSHRHLKQLLGSLLVTGVALAPLAADDSSKIEIQRNAADQTDVKAHTAAVSNAVQSLIDELQANGISGADTKVLQATKSVLSHLSTTEMEKVITALQKAGSATSASAASSSAFDAYAGQKGIILQFQQILKEYSERQAAYELPIRFKELTQKQTDTMTTTVTIARDTVGKNAIELTTSDQTTQQIVQSDQESLINEVNLAQQQLDAAVQDATGDDARPMQQAQADLKTGKLQQALAQANDDLKAGKLLKAINEQKVARDELHHITQDLNPPTNAVDALTQSAADLDKLIGEQTSLLTETNNALGAKTMISGLNDKQGGLVDEADTLQRDMTALSPGAAALVKDAINPPMQGSRSALGNLQSFAQAAIAEQAAIAKLQEAQKALQQQLADAEKAEAEAEKDPVAQLQDLQKQIQTAMQEQKQATSQTAQADSTSPPDPTQTAQAQQQQAKTQQDTAALQQSALPVSLPAAQALSTATAAMSKAQQDMTDPANAANAAADQQAAQDALAQADKAVSQQIAQDQQAAADPAALAAAANDLQNAQDSASAANADASAQSNSPSPSSPAAGDPTMAQAAAALADAEKSTDAAAATPGLPTDAADAVADAKSDIGKGEAAAAKGDAPGTAAAAAAAQNALAKAQASVAMAQAGMAPAPGAPGNQPGNQPGKPMPGPASMAKTAPGPDTPSTTGAKTVGGGNLDKNALHGTPSGPGKFITVTSRDRQAIELTQGEKRPQEYAPMIDQYMKNLSDQSSSSSTP